MHAARPRAAQCSFSSHIYHFAHHRRRRPISHRTTSSMHNSCDPFPLWGFPCKSALASSPTPPLPIPFRLDASRMRSAGAQHPSRLYIRTLIHSYRTDTCIYIHTHHRRHRIPRIHRTRTSFLQSGSTSLLYSSSLDFRRSRVFFWLSSLHLDLLPPRPPASAPCAPYSSVLCLVGWFSFAGLSTRVDSALITSSLPPGSTTVSSLSPSSLEVVASCCRAVRCTLSLINQYFRSRVAGSNSCAVCHVVCARFKRLTTYCTIRYMGVTQDTYFTVVWAVG